MAETKSALLVFYERILPNKNYPSMLAVIHRPVDICATSPLRLIKGSLSFLSLGKGAVEFKQGLLKNQMLQLQI